MPYKNPKDKKAHTKRYYAQRRDEINRKRREDYIPHPRKRKTDEETKIYHKEYNKKWYQENKEVRSKQIKEYARNHKEDSVRRVQRYVMKHKEKVQQYNKSFNGTIEGRYRMLLYRAKKWGAPYITIEEFNILVSSQCNYCGGTKKPRGIDRVDNSKGYSTENSVSCCKICNFMKKTMSREDFISHVKKIAQYAN